MWLWSGNIHCGKYLRTLTFWKVNKTIQKKIVFSGKHCEGVIKEYIKL